MILLALYIFFPPPPFKAKILNIPGIKFIIKGYNNDKAKLIKVFLIT